jgi:hypothetical protein
LYKTTRGEPPSLVTVNLNLVGSGSVTTSPYNCTAGNVGTCSATLPYDSSVMVYASQAAYWSGSCAANGAALSSDAIVHFTFGTPCTVTFP